MADLLSAKLALEDDLAPRLYRLIGRYVRARVQVRYLSPLAVQQAQAAFAELLQRHYARVVMVVTGRGWPRSPDIKEAALSWWHYERLVERSRKSAEMLIRSIERVVLETEAPQRKSLDFAEYKAGLAGELWRKAKAVMAKIKGKLKGIVAAETVARTPPGGGPVSLVAVTPNSSLRLAYAATDNDVALLQTGQAVRTATGVGFPAGLNKLNVGSYNAGSFSQNGVCKSVALWGSRRTNAAMAGWVG